jgi:glycosyltransferase involved in cell wall biosynthesis
MYNVEKYIKRCAESLFRQTYSNIEYIFVNDCSPDNSLSVLLETMNAYTDKKECCQVISHVKNRGLSAARNTAIDAATGDFLCFVDADDYLENSAIQLLVEKQIETGADIVSGNAYKHIIDGIIEMKEPKYACKEDMVCGLIQATFDHVIWRRIIRRSLFEIYNIRMKEGINQGEDWQVMPKLAYFANRYATISEFIYHYDCTNDNSYMSRMQKRLDTNQCDQDLASMSIVETFFSTKAPIYQEAVARMKTLFLYKYLHKCAKYRNKSFFEKVRSSLYKVPDQYYNYIGWNNPLKKHLTGNYYFMLVYKLFF